jgi:hypothetical protein
LYDNDGCEEKETYFGDHRIKMIKILTNEYLTIMGTSYPVPGIRLGSLLFRKWTVTNEN